MSELTEMVIIDETELQGRLDKMAFNAFMKGLIIGGLLATACIGFAALMQGAI